VNEYQLQEASEDSFADAHEVYRGPHTGRVISGLRDGTFHYRVRHDSVVGWSEWSTAVEFRVEHPPLATALALFGLGALVFAATSWVVVRGARDDDDAEGAA
jgi:hypothetical protein